MKLTRLSKTGLLLTGFGLLICFGYAIWLKSVRTNVLDIPMSMRLEAHNNSYYPLGFLLCLIGAILFLVPFLKAKSKQSKPPDPRNS
jgi:hypothetical protein